MWGVSTLAIMLRPLHDLFQRTELESRQRSVIVHL